MTTGSYSAAAVALRNAGPRRLARRAAILVGALVALALTPAPGLAATGDLTQKSGQAGCIRQHNPGLVETPPPDPFCADGRGLGFGQDVVVSPDGRSAYSVSSQPGAVAIFDRNPATGELTQKDGLAGCITETGADYQSGGEPEIRCQTARVLAFALAVTVSPDGRNVYVVSLFGVAIFDRDTTTGVLTQKEGKAGCITEDGTDGAGGTPDQCEIGRALLMSRSVAVSPDGRTVYVAAGSFGEPLVSDAVVIFDRDPITGALTQRQGLEGCIAETGTDDGCADGKALTGAHSVVVSPDGRSVYVTSETAVAIFDRNAATGVLTQKQDLEGCISETGTDGACADGRALDQSTAAWPDFPPFPPRSVAISPDGRNVYVASFASEAVAVLDRNLSTGALTQKEGTAGCISEEGTDGCANGRVLRHALGLAVSPDGESVYVATYGIQNVSTSSPYGLAVFDRESNSGALSQKEGTAGCVQDTSVTASEGCAVGHGLEGVQSVTVSPDGRNVYSIGQAKLAIFDRELPPDTDNDGVFDASDRCPNQPGPASNQGCPVAGAGPGGGGRPAPVPVSPAAPFADCPTATANLIRGTIASESINGTPRADRIFAGTGNDTVDGLAADDCIDLGPGTDRGQGGDGADLLVGGLGADRMSGNLGNDRLRGGSAADSLIGGFGDDTLHGQSGSDVIKAERGRDRVNGGSSNDVISAGSSGDRVAGDQGNDRINGNSGNDSLSGNSGRDQLKGSSGRDRFSGGSGNDKISARDGQRDRVNCGAGRDTVIADARDRVAGNCEKVTRR